jgi:hypothetical protein
MSAVYFTTEGNRGSAFWRAGDEAEDVFVCAVALDIYEREPEAKKLFAELVNVIAAHYRRTFVAKADKPASRLAGYPCAECKAPEADEIRHLAGQVSDLAELPMSPSGFPLNCCRVRTVGGMSGRPDTSRSMGY